MDGASEEDAEDKDGDEEVDGESPASDLASASCAARRREVKRLGAGESLNGLSGLDRGGVVSDGDASVGEPSRGGVRDCCMVVLLVKGRWISPAKLLMGYSQLVYAQAKLWKGGKGCAGRSADQQERQGELREQRMSKKGTLVRWCDLSLREGERDHCTTWHFASGMFLHGFRGVVSYKGKLVVRRMSISIRRAADCNARQILSVQIVELQKFFILILCG